ncbi:MAG: DUF4157 domain-containing protein [Dehalococcoidia bacterium]|nr:DUF4157 domain-containing protein [Dehalococcoidia bacterium]
MTYTVGTAGLYALAWAKLKTKLFDILRVVAGSKDLLDSEEALDETTRSEMESTFGYDLRDVRVHRTKQAGELARRLQAEAFTIGADIFAGEGKMETETGEGKGLLVHELTHVIQQTHPQPVVPGYEIAKLELFPVSGVPQLSIRPGYHGQTAVPAPQLATSNALPTAGRSALETMETMAETAEQDVRRWTEGIEERWAATPSVDAEEIAERVYQMMERELLLEKDRIGR